MLQEFLQGVLETGTEATKRVTGIETKGEKRSSLEEGPSVISVTTKKHKPSINEHGSSQFKNNVLSEDICKVRINNIKKNETQNSGKLNSVHEVRNVNLNATETEVHLTRNDVYKQSSLRMQLDERCSALSNNCPDMNTWDMCVSKVNTLSDARYKHCGNNVSKGKATLIVIFSEICTKWTGSDADFGNILDHDSMLTEGFLVFNLLHSSSEQN